MTTALTTQHTATPAEIVDLPLHQITLHPDLQPRAKVDQQTVDDYAAAMADGTRFPPVVVFTTNPDDDEPLYLLADGWHRYRAAHKLALLGHYDCEVIPAIIYPGTRRDALLYAIQANTTHGLRLTNADKRRIVTTLLGDEEWSQHSDRELARLAGTSHTFVANLRREQTGNGCHDDDSAAVTAPAPDGPPGESEGITPDYADDDDPADLPPEARDYDHECNQIRRARIGHIGQAIATHLAGTAGPVAWKGSIWDAIRLALCLGLDCENRWDDLSQIGDSRLTERLVTQNTETLVETLSFAYHLHLWPDLADVCEMYGLHYPQLKQAADDAHPLPSKGA